MLFIKEDFIGPILEKLQALSRIEFEDNDDCDDDYDKRRPKRRRRRRKMQQRRRKPVELITTLSLYTDVKEIYHIVQTTKKS